MYIFAWKPFKNLITYLELMRKIEYYNVDLFQDVGIYNGKCIRN